MSADRRSSSTVSPSTGVTNRRAAATLPQRMRRTAAATARLAGGVLGPVHDRLPLYVLLAAAMGVVFDGVAGRLDGVVPVLLGGQVAGVALTLTASQLLRVARSPRCVVVAMAVQWTVVPLSGIGIARISGAGTVGDGVAITAVAPAEITSALVALLAGGGAALALSTMAASLALGTVLTPIWLSIGLGSVAGVDRVGLIRELALSVAMPLVICVGLRTRLPGLGRQGARARALDLASLSVILVVFISAGRIRPLLGHRELGVAVCLCLLLLVAQFGAGWLCATVLRLPAAERSAILFPIGMREFGVAAAVAFAVAPASAGVAGLYGCVLMFAGPVLARLLRPPGYGPAGVQPAPRG